MEKEWIDLLKNNINNYSKNYCLLVNPFKERLNKLSKDIEKCKNNGLKECNGKDLSYFLYQDSEGKITKEYIEPLFGILRNTFSICDEDSKGDILSKDYLLPSYILAFKKPIVYIDAGASSFYDGLGGSSQSYFYNFYRQNHTAEFDKWYLWEVTKQNMKEIEEQVPNDLHNKYFYYNRPIDIDKGSKDNPLNVIRQHKDKSYVIFKLDVDTPSVELPIFNYLLEYNDTLPDEFYFEYHFYQPYMMRWWGHEVDKKCTLFCATIKFLKLRRKGIRAHPWL